MAYNYLTRQGATASYEGSLIIYQHNILGLISQHHFEDKC